MFRPVQNYMAPQRWRCDACFVSGANVYSCYANAFTSCTYLKEVAMVQQYLRQYEPEMQAR
jgi:hypothetical protein